jgi:phage shock protein PspC (stress-responsive transcriptional regulator)
MSDGVDDDLVRTIFFVLLFVGVFVYVYLLTKVEKKR